MDTNTLRDLDLRATAGAARLGELAHKLEQQLAGIDRRELKPAAVEDRENQARAAALAEAQPILERHAGLGETIRQAREHYAPEAVRLRASLRSEPARYLAVRSSVGAASPQRLRTMAALAAADGNAAVLDALDQEVSRRGDALRADTAEPVREAVERGTRQSVADAEAAIASLERNAFELREAERQLRYGGRRFTVSQLEGLDQAAFERARRAEQAAAEREAMG